MKQNVEWRIANCEGCGAAPLVRLRGSALLAVAMVVLLAGRVVAQGTSSGTTPTGSAAQPPTAQPTTATEQPPAGQRLGEVTGNSVYVRSGASQNHYPVCKLDAGAVVTILGEDGGWYAIVPPKGTFSLVAGDFVDTADGKSGIINGDNVNVRAGSLLTDNRDWVQTKLSKGAEVRIIERLPDGFYKVEPPAGVKVYVSKEYVAALAPGARPVGRPAQASGAGATSPAESKEAAPATVETPAATTPAPVPATRFDPAERQYRVRLEEIDSAVRAELSKPAPERNVTPFIDQYAEIVRGTRDETTRQYAEIRLNQVRSISQLLEAVRRNRTSTEQVDEARQSFLTERLSIVPLAPMAPGGFDARGEIRPSAVYRQPPRWRLVDPSETSGKTMAYLELPPRSELDLDTYVGRYVGIRAREKRLLQGMVHTVPLYVVTEVVPLEPDAVEEDEGEAAGAVEGGGAP